MEPINPLGFPAPFAPPLIWIFSVINKCKFRCACILKSTFQHCYGILRVSLSSKQIFFSLTCTYCIWIMLVCQIYCFVTNLANLWTQIQSSKVSDPMYCVCQALKLKIDDANFVATVGARGCRFDNSWFYQWRQSWHQSDELLHHCTRKCSVTSRNNTGN